MAECLITRSGGTSGSGANTREDVTGLSVNLNSYTNAVTRLICTTPAGSSNIDNLPVANTAFTFDADIIRYVDATDYITKQTFICSNDKQTYVRWCTNGTFDTWANSTFTAETQQEIDELVTSVNAVSDTVGTLSSTVSNHTSSISALDTTVGQHTSSIDSLNTTVGQHTSSISGLSTRMTTAEGNISSNDSDISALQTTVGNHTNSINTLNSNVTAIRNDTTYMHTNAAQTMSAKLVAQSNADYTVQQCRNVVTLTAVPTTVGSYGYGTVMLVTSS